MNYTSEHDDTPPPPSNWWVFGVILVFLVVFIFFALSVTSCTCTLDGESVARAIIVYQSGK